MVRIPAVDTAADLIERLIIIDNRQAWFEEHKRNAGDLTAEQIALYDRKSRDCNEARSEVKNRINEVFEEIAGGQYEAIRESRSFRPPPERFAEVLDRHSAELAHYFTSEEFSESIRAELLGEVHSHAPLGADDPPSVAVD